MAVGGVLRAQTPCVVEQPTATMSIPHVANPGELTADPKSKMWSKSATAWMVKDCSKTLDYPNLKTEIRGFWSDTDLYLLFKCP